MVYRFLDGWFHHLLRNSHLQGIRLVLPLLNAATRSPDPPRDGIAGWKMWKNMWENPGESWKDVSKFGQDPIQCPKKMPEPGTLCVDNSGAKLSIHDFA